MRYIFGPVPSRRLGSSLGIDIVPHKTCNLDCIYCEVGKTTRLTNKRRSFIDLDLMFKEFEQAYSHLKDHIDVVTITGAGEPTLNSDLHKIIKEIKKVISHPLALLTNSTLIDNDDVQNALMDLDLIVPSVDAISLEVIKKINKPHKRLNWDNILKALKDFSHQYNGKIFIETLFVKGINDNEEEFNRLADYFKELKYTKIQLNTVFRPPAYPETRGLTGLELLDIAIFFRKKGLIVEPVGNFVREIPPHVSNNLKDTIITLLKMRPCTMEDLRLLFSINENDIENLLNDIEIIEKKTYNNETYLIARNK
ncbi:radical SAM protein [Calditerrivibrio nitroreducens]|uniref:Radical SAM domain protein n=1 Tax=Calditerrivibrio nitroreducens (strain DSM 19672 / NBRC 101217 / Yu37-1) TaxID=768670 RepID=E4TFQ2_CALNY|nr:radical SAM protein [Calditerrivibrio nitroreducens]ADR18520.1 Radical SAM domain protein [Calditerrivibrio nitroreducens DSM 19672]